MGQVEKYSAFTAKSDNIMRKLTSNVFVRTQYKSVEAIALWDTGAYSTCISSDVAFNLGLIPDGMQTIQTPSGSKIVNTYLVDIELPNGVIIKEVHVCDSDIGNQGIGVLVGMDIISMGDLSVSNFDGKTVYSFRVPSKKMTDYVLEERISSAIGLPHGKGKNKRK